MEILSKKDNTLKYKAFSINNFRNIDQIYDTPIADHLGDLEVVGNVLPFKANNYVVNQLIDWSNVPSDPVFQLTFPQKEMLSPEMFHKASEALNSGLGKPYIKQEINEIRETLNPHPADQIELNVPSVEGLKYEGFQHKYDQTVLFFPKHGQTCHAYCSFCFRWPQFVGIKELKFASQEVGLLIEYLKAHPGVTDILFTGGDPMVMNTERLKSYIEPLLSANIPNLRNIRIGTKALGYWPYRFTHDKDAEELLALFEKVNNSGYQLAFMAHFNHSKELSTEAVKKAIKRIRATGTVIRTQAPVMKHINDSAAEWSKMIELQIELGCIPYYMFIARDTGAQEYFAVPLDECYEIYTETMKNLSGLGRHLRGPVMSTSMGKMQIIDILKGKTEKVLLLKCIQARDNNQTGKTFLYKYKEGEVWLDLNRLQDLNATSFNY